MPHPDQDDEAAGDAMEAPAGADDETFAVNLRRRRDAQVMSQGELARRMVARGFPWYQQTVRRVEDGTRKVSVGEAVVLAGLLDTTLEELTRPTPEADAAEAVQRAAAGIKRNYLEVTRAVAGFTAAREKAAEVFAATEGTGWPRIEELRALITKRLAQYTLDAAIAEAGESAEPADSD
jgi:hypothetical protein